MPIFEVEIREVTSYQVTVDAPTAEAARLYGRLYAPNYIVFAGIKPVEDTGLYFQAARPSKAAPTVTVNESGEELIVIE